MRSLRAQLASASPAERRKFLRSLSPNALRALPYLFSVWGMDHQLPPEGDWQSWVILGGRGAGKTRAGAEWVRMRIEGATPLGAGPCQHIALIGETFDQAREVMVAGESGILACSPPDRRPKWHTGRKCLIWPNGAEARVISAHDPEMLRGPQFDGAWLDELAKWKKARAVWDQLQFTLRLGDDPRAVITTTPRNTPLLKEILGDAKTVQTHAPTSVNAANLAPSFVASLKARYGQTRLGQQEIAGEFVDAVDDCLWPEAHILAAQKAQPIKHDRVVLAVDPGVSKGNTGDACGIVIAGVDYAGSPQNWRAEVIHDGTITGASPSAWGDAVVRLASAYRVDCVVAEVNQGGALVENLLRQKNALLPYRAVHASRSKAARAEPIAALYEQGRVGHSGELSELERQLGQMTRLGYQGTGSPDRVDALVWALTDLMIDPAKQFLHPKIRAT